MPELDEELRRINCPFAKDNSQCKDCEEWDSKSNDCYFDDRKEQVKLSIKAFQESGWKPPEKRSLDDLTKQLRPLLISGNTGFKTARAVYRAYQQDYFTKPLEDLTDEELLELRYFGPVMLKTFRSVFPKEVKSA